MTQPIQFTLMGAIYWGLALLGGALVGFIAGYVKKKGENVAINENLKALVAQMSAVTAATKKIETDIEGGLWDRQKRWELRREVLLEAVKRLSEVQDALTELYSVNSLLKTLGGDSTTIATWQKSWKEALLAWATAVNEFGATKLRVVMVSNSEVSRSLFEFATVYYKAGLELANKSDGSLYDSTSKERQTLVWQVLGAIRKDLGIETELPEQTPRV